MQKRPRRRATKTKGRVPEMASNHQRNTTPMLESLRCGARTRAGTLCLSPAVRGKRRCRMHGGAKGSGAPQGNSNARKHGSYTREAFERRAATQRLLQEAAKLISCLGASH